MKVLKVFAVLFLVSIATQAQIVPKDSLSLGNISKENDSIIDKTVLLEEVVVSKQKLSPEEKKQFLILQNRVLRVYPYAKIAADRLSALNRNMASLQTAKEKKKYFKIVEDYLENEFTGQLKKLSKKQGQILVKLINRQTGVTTYNLIKELKSGWKAFWSNNAANLFDISLKMEYKPLEVNEDYFIETILYRAFSTGRLPEQVAANPVDYNELADIWQKKALGK
jgi:ABC-type transporter MlaC component